MLVPPGATLADFPIAAFQSALLHWFKDNKRALPWREEPRAPYHVWLAETMLQQTQVGTGAGKTNGARCGSASD